METRPSIFRRRGFWIGIIFILLLSANLRLFWEDLRVVIQSLYQMILLLGTGGLDAPFPPARVIVRSVLALILGLGVGIGGTSWLAIRAILPFLLPVRARSERNLLQKRFIDHLFNRDAPTIFIRDGATEASKEELDSIRPGVILVNVNSAIALESKAGSAAMNSAKRRKKPVQTQSKPRVRICGPGIIFSEKNETVYGMVDLRTQVRSRSDVHGYTLDGIEVKTNISITFTLGQPPETILVTRSTGEESGYRIVILEEAKQRANHPPRSAIRLVNELNQEEIEEIIAFKHRVGGMGGVGVPPPERNAGEPVALKPEFNPERVFKAIYSQPLEPHGTISTWSDLPADRAASLFRDLLSRETYDGLYALNADGRTVLEELQARFNRLMQQEGILGFQLVERRDGLPLREGEFWNEAEMVRYPVKEFQNGRFLRNCGIKVLMAGFSEPLPVNELILQQRLDTWQAKWQRETEIRRAFDEYEADGVRNKARLETQNEMIQALNRILNESHFSQEAIAIQLFQELEAAASDPATHKLLPQEVVKIIATVKPFLLPEEGDEQPMDDSA